MRKWGELSNRKHDQAIQGKIKKHGPNESTRDKEKGGK